MMDVMNRYSKVEYNVTGRWFIDSMSRLVIEGRTKGWFFYRIKWMDEGDIIEVQECGK